MTVTLLDLESDDLFFDINFWHWRAIVEAVRALKVISEEEADLLHEQYQETGLSREQARAVAAALRSVTIPKLHINDRLLLDGSVTQTPDDFVFYRDLGELHKNYSTNREILEKFAVFCEACNGFSIY